MTKKYLYLTLSACLLVAAMGINSCTRVNGVDNEQVIETPFTVFFADASGAVYSSNDGSTVNKEIFEADTYPAKAIMVAYNNILIAKKNLYVSMDNGTSFNHSFDSSGNRPGNACYQNFPIDLNQSMIGFIPGWNYLYVANGYEDPVNFMGVSYNYYGGQQGEWWLDQPDSLFYFGQWGSLYPVRVTSFAYLPDDTLCAYDALHGRCFYRTKTTLWNECTANPDPTDYGAIGDDHDYSGNGLPHDRQWDAAPVAPGTGTTDTSARYFYGHYNNRLIAVDEKNCHDTGAFYSDDRGRNWSPYFGLPSRPLLCMQSPFQDVALIGTHGAGVYILNNNTNTWQADNNGLPANCSVYGITGKQRIYKNGKTASYIFLATDQGIFQSLDDAQTWTLTHAGSFTAIY